MINTVNIDLTNSSCWGTTNEAGIEGENDILLYIKLLEGLLEKTDIHLEFTKPDGTIIITDSLSTVNGQISYEIPFSLYVTKGTLKLRILTTGYTSDYINFNILADYTETDDICVKFNIETREFNINKCVIESVLLKAYPIGSIYMSVNNINPSNLFGGTWEAWGEGRTLVGVDTTQTEFATVEKTGGEKTHKLTINEMPSHTHNLQHTNGTANHTDGFWVSGDYNKIGEVLQTLSTGGNQPHNNLQPYITCYMWKRTA